MNKLKSTGATLAVWSKKLKLTKFALLLLMGLSLALLRADSSPVQDQAHLVNAANRQIVLSANQYYQQTKAKPQLILLTYQHLDHLQPAGLNRSQKSVYIVVGQKGQRRSVQLFSSRDLHNAFTRPLRLNIIGAKKQELAAKNPAEFNQGLHFVIRACITQINRHYNFDNQDNTLSLQEQLQLNHPRRLRWAIMAGLIIVLALFIFFYRKWRR
jgi:hypothetical protein